MTRIFIVFFFILCSAICVAQEGSSSPTVDDIFGKKSGNLRMSSFKVDFGKIKSNEQKSDTIFLFNEGKYPVGFNMVATKLPAHIKLNFKNVPVKPGGKGYMIVNYDPYKKGDFGFVMDRLQCLLGVGGDVLKHRRILFAISHRRYRLH